MSNIKGSAQAAEHIARRVASTMARLAKTTRQCSHCSASYTPTSCPQKYCSGSCFDKARKARGQGWRPERRARLKPEAYAALFEAQRGLCAICKIPSGSTGRGRLAVDHCHATGRIRGLLCARCNTSLGLLKDSISSLRAAIEYLAPTN